MMNHSKRQTRIRTLRRWRDNTLEHVAYLIVFGIFVYVFFLGPFIR